jgi:hypothetical protein
VTALGAQVPLAIDVEDGNGVPVNAGSVTLTITKPAGTTDTPTVPAPSPTGHYEVDYTTTAQGRHTFRWVTTTPAGAYEGVFDVRSGTPKWIIGLDDAKTQLNITSTGDDAELTGYLDAATAIVEDAIGPVANRVVTEYHDGGSTVLVLRKLPVVEITSVTPVATGSSALTVADLYVTSAGIVRYRGGGWFPSSLEVTYVAGRSNQSPPAARLAAQIIVQHLWRTQHGGSPVPYPGGEETVPTGFGYAVPYRALELLRPYRNSFGVA